jgi:hypothetical protein
MPDPKELLPILEVGKRLMQVEVCPGGYVPLFLVCMSVEERNAWIDKFSETSSEEAEDMLWDQLRKEANHA